MSCISVCWIVYNMCVKAPHGIPLVHILTILEVMIVKHFGHLSLQISILLSELSSIVRYHPDVTSHEVLPTPADVRSRTRDDHVSAVRSKGYRGTIIHIQSSFPSTWFMPRKHVSVPRNATGIRNWVGTI